MGHLAIEILSEFSDEPLDDLRIGDAYVGAKVGNRIGMAHRVDESNIDPEKCMQFIGKCVSDQILSYDPLNATIAAAAINAQLKPNNLHMGNIFELILKISANYRTIGVIGKFPIIDDLRRLNCKLYTFEKKDIPGFLPAERVKDFLPACDLVIITGTAFVNRTLEHLLELCSGYTIVVGPTTPLTEILFDFGVDVLGGIICNNSRALDIISQGGGTKEFKKFVDLVYMIKKEHKK